MRKNIVAGNWKMNTTLQEGVALAKEIDAALAGVSTKCDVIIATPFTHLVSVVNAIDTKRIGVGAENCADKTEGAYTGEVSAKMVASTGAQYVILGHSERRAYYHETPEILKEKVLLALANGLTPIFCIGEVLEEREAGKHFDVVKAQVEESLFNLSAEDFGKIILAYEPVWAIGTGKTATADQAQEIHAFIRKTIADFNPEEVDMFTVILIGNSQSYAWNGKFITPRGYYNRPDKDEQPTKGIGQDIMIQSFRTIESELKNKNIPLDHKWALLHAIHTTADFEMEKLLYTDKGAVEKLYQKIADGRLKTIVTDVTMAASGIRKGALQRLGVEVKCYLSDERVAAMAAEKGITRTQAGIRLAVEEHPDALFVFGNAPTALMELCDLVRKGKAVPSGIIAAPVGFVHVQESKHMVKPFIEIPKLIVEGRKGGSNLAATLVNAILCYNDAELLRPGRDV